MSQVKCIDCGRTLQNGEKICDVCGGKMSERAADSYFTPEGQIKKNKYHTSGKGASTYNPPKSNSEKSNQSTSKLGDLVDTIAGGGDDSYSGEHKRTPIDEFGTKVGELFNGSDSERGKKVGALVGSIGFVISVLVIIGILIFTYYSSYYDYDDYEEWDSSSYDEIVSVYEYDTNDYYEFSLMNIYGAGTNIYNIDTESTYNVAELEIVNYQEKILTIDFNTDVKASYDGEECNIENITVLDNNLSPVNTENSQLDISNGEVYKVVIEWDTSIADWDDFTLKYKFKGTADDKWKEFNVVNPVENEIYEDEELV